MGHRFSRVIQRIDQLADDMVEAGLDSGGEGVVRVPWGNHSLEVSAKELVSLFSHEAVPEDDKRLAHEDLAGAGWALTAMPYLPLVELITALCRFHHDWTF